MLFPEALDLVGVATEPGEATARSQDVIYIDARDWTPEMQAQAEDLHAKGVLKNADFRGGVNCLIDTQLVIIVL